MEELCQKYGTITEKGKEAILEVSSLLTKFSNSHFSRKLTPAYYAKPAEIQFKKYDLVKAKAGKYAKLGTYKRHGKQKISYFNF